MIHKKPLYSLLGIGFLSLSNIAYAFTVNLPCANCAGTLKVPLGVSNEYMSFESFLLILLIFIIVLFNIIYKFIKKNPVLPSDYLILLFIGIFSCGYFVTSYMDTQYKKEFSGQYEYNNKKLKFVMKNNELINHDNNEPLEAMGIYLYDAKEKHHFMKNDDDFYLVDLEKRIVYKLSKKSN